MDPTKPTLCIAECVLVYMSAAQSAQLVRNFAQFFTSIAFVNYEQVRVWKEGRDGVRDRFA
jgi:O-methyltransferase involved in polyketide biosynthesis